ncbi:MAG: hypothetical protein IK130_09140 [Oscillospiraceae bacterium]|nr:hypothetical protein [Oscillospiraceae bacterium]
MIKLLGKGNDLYTEEGQITKAGYAVMLLSTLFGLCVFLTGRCIYGRAVRAKHAEK